MNSVHAAGLLAALAAAGVAAEDAPAERRNFVACPVVRDTASVPCWLAEYDGELYFLTLQTDVSSPVTPPWLGHRVLVEGRPAPPDRPRICGGIVLEPVVLSVLPELDASCNTPVLPAEDRYNLSFEPPRPPGPSAGRLAFAGAAAPPAPAEPPRSFALRYDFDGLIVFRHAAALTAIFDAARTRKSGRLEITAYRGSVLLSNGTTLVEQPAIARKRAEQVAELLRGAGLTDVEYRVRWHDEAQRADGDDAELRRVTVELDP